MLTYIVLLKVIDIFIWSFVDGNDGGHQSRKSLVQKNNNQMPYDLRKRKRNLGTETSSNGDKSEQSAKKQVRSPFLAHLHQILNKTIFYRNRYCLLKLDLFSCRKFLLATTI